MGKTVTLDVGHQVFKNPVLDFLSRSHPIVPLLVFVPIAIGSVIWGAFELHRVGHAWWHVAWLAPAGLLFWTLAEYLLHRFLFHFVPKAEPWHTMFYNIHMVHHDYIERDRLVAPPLMWFPIFLFFLAMFYVGLGLPFGWGFSADGHGGWMLPSMAGFIVGYLGYDYVHYMTHFMPKLKLLKGLRRRHMQHHYAYPDCWYGVSSPLWDFVLGTYVKKGMKPNREASTIARDEGGPEAEAQVDAGAIDDSASAIAKPEAAGEAELASDNTDAGCEQHATEQRELQPTGSAAGSEATHTV